MLGPIFFEVEREQFKILLIELLSMILIVYFAICFDIIIVKCNWQIIYESESYRKQHNRNIKHINQMEKYSRQIYNGEVRDNQRNQKQNSRLRLRQQQGQAGHKCRQSNYIQESPYFRSPLRDTLQMNWNDGYKCSPSRIDTQGDNRRSSISTSRNKQKMVRFLIKTLPHHQSTNLSSTPTHILVFQTIEIQRLSEQIQTQRTKIRQLQRKLINVSNYEIQIKQLTDQCCVLETEIAEYRDQLNKMNTICERLYRDNQVLKQFKNNSTSVRNTGMSDIDRNKTTNINTIVKRNKLLQEQASQAKIDLQKLNIQMQQIRAQNTQLNKLLKKRHSIDSKEGHGKEFEKYKQIIAVIENRQQQSNIKVQTLSRQILRLTQVLQNKNEQIQKLCIQTQKIQQKPMCVPSKNCKNCGDECSCDDLKQHKLLMEINSLTKQCENNQEFICNNLKSLGINSNLGSNSNTFYSNRSDHDKTAQKDKHKDDSPIRNLSKDSQNLNLSYSSESNSFKIRDIYGQDRIKEQEKNIRNRIKQLQDTIQELRSKYIQVLHIVDSLTQKPHLTRDIAYISKSESMGDTHNKRDRV